MRIYPDRQTLILAGEPLPRRTSAATGTSVAARNNAASRSTYVSGRFDGLASDAEVTDAEYTPSADVVGSNVVAADVGNVGNAGLPAATPRTSLTSSRAYSFYASTSRASSFEGASAYARTQDLSERHPIIDTYA